MKLGAQVRVLLAALLLAPATFLLGMFLLAITAHSEGLLWDIGACLVPGMLVFNFLPYTPYGIPVGMAAQFILFLVIGQIHLHYRQRWRSWRDAAEEKWLGEKWESWFNRK